MMIPDRLGLVCVIIRHFLDAKLMEPVANHSTTSNPTKPLTVPVLYMDDYGFHTGISLYRASVTGTPTSLNLSLQGGTAFGYSVYMNGGHLYSYTGNSTATSHNVTVAITPSSLKGETNTLLVVMDNTGHDETSGALNPRGILSASVTDGSISSWKIAGTAGGEANIDPIRGPLSEGGLTSERLGWHLPSFPTSTAWPSLSPSTGTTNAGITFYRTAANLTVPAGTDTSVIFTLTTPSNMTALRAILWVNGYNYGLFNPSVGNQIEFPVPTGILDQQGENTIALSIWNQGDGSAAARVDVGWKVAYVHESGFDFGFDAKALRPGWDSSRSVYV
jgi:beta-galactosidase GanA